MDLLFDKLRSVRRACLDKGRARLYLIPKSELLDYIKAAGPLDSLSSRAYAQYLYEREYQAGYINLIQSLGGIISLIAILISCVRSGGGLKEVDSGLPLAIYMGASANDGIIPPAITNEYRVLSIPFLKKVKYDQEVFRLWKRECLSKCKDPYYLAQTLLYLGNCNYAIQNYRPAAVVTTSESSFACSLITQICRSNHVEHICVMHGEKILQPGTAFFEVDKFYVWDTYYIELFNIERAKVKKYVICNPWVGGEVKRKPVVQKCTYYLQELDKDCSGLISVISALKEKGYWVTVRPHPLNVSDKRLFGLNANEIEDPKCISILQSLGNTDLVISRYSTVLFQAWSMGIPICIDDITNIEIYRYLVNYNYIMLSKSHLLLSDIERSE